ncbi:MAG: BON domain-containing protein, partial [Deltaproteobacteria bacterium]|nr:BON domain-containing protein [Deltaproteobacteria bacterium]
HHSTSALNTNVETTRGAVVLYGKANNAAELSLATKLASDVNGVKSVTNRMVIK